MATESLSNDKFYGPGGLALTPTDKEIFRQDIDWFLPSKVFDMHVHLHGRVRNSWPSVGLRLVKDFQKMCYPHRQCADLLLPCPFEGLTTEQVNSLAVRELRNNDDEDSEGDLVIKDYLAEKLGVL